MNIYSYLLLLTGFSHAFSFDATFHFFADVEVDLVLVDRQALIVTVWTELKYH